MQRLYFLNAFWIFQFGNKSSTYCYHLAIISRLPAIHISILKSSSFMGPNSRPSSPALAPTSVHPNQVDGAPVPGGSRTLSSFYMSSFKRPSPLSSTTTATNSPLTTLVQDGTYLDVLSLKLSEAVSKALAQPNGPPVAHELLGNKKPIPPGRGRTLGALITA